jgi:hypothetical protein
VLAEVAGEVFPDIVRANGKLSVSSVDEYGQPDCSGPAEVNKRVEGGANGAAREQDIIDEHDDSVVDPAVWLGGVVGSTMRGLVKIVPVQRGVENPDRRGDPGDVSDVASKPAREGGATSGNTEKNQCRGIGRALDDFVGHALNRALDIRFADDQVSTHRHLLLRLAGRWLK